jgi:hypothetical protein
VVRNVNKGVVRVPGGLCGQLIERNAHS